LAMAFRVSPDTIAKASGLDTATALSIRREAYNKLLMRATASGR
jgi:hypothetical protein